MESRINAALFGMIAVVAGGALAACTAATLTAGIFYILYSHGDLTAVQAILATLLTSTIAATGLLALGYHKIKSSLSGLESEEKPSNSKDENVLSEIINGFMNGLISGSPYTRKPTTK